MKTKTHGVLLLTKQIKKPLESTRDWQISVTYAYMASPTTTITTTNNAPLDNQGHLPFSV